MKKLIDKYQNPSKPLQRDVLPYDTNLDKISSEWQDFTKKGFHVQGSSGINKGNITKILNISPKTNELEVLYDGVDGEQHREWMKVGEDQGFWAPVSPIRHSQTFEISERPKLSNDVIFGKLQGIVDPETNELLFPSDPRYNNVHMKYNRGFYNPFSGGELKNNQYRTMPTNQEASNYADQWTERTAPGIGSILQAGLFKPMDALSISRYIGGLKGHNIYDDKNPGPFSSEFAQEHPWLTAGGNFMIDLIGAYGLGKVAQGGANLYNAMSGIYNNKGFAITSPNGMSIKWVPLNRVPKEPLSRIQLAPHRGDIDVAFVESSYPGEGRKLYDAAIKSVGPIISGKGHVSAPKYINTLKYYPDRKIISNNGEWSNFNMVESGIPLENVTVNSLDEFKNVVKRIEDSPFNNIFVEYENAPIYEFRTPYSDNIQLYKLPSKLFNKIR